jgi:hypothetical protein
MNLPRYTDTWTADDPHANFKAEVACYTVHDPLPTLQRLSAGTGVPVESIVRYVLVKYATSGSDALLAMTPIVFRQMQDIIERAEQGGEETKLAAYESLKQIVQWLALAAES